MGRAPQGGRQSAAEGARAGVALLLRLTHALVWGVLAVAGLGFLALCAAAYGVRGSWVQGWLDRQVAPEMGRVSFKRCAYLPGRGVTLEGLALHDGEGKLLAGFARARVQVRLWGKGAWYERLSGVEIEELYVAQLEHDPEAPVERVPLPPELRRKLPDFAAWPIPDLPPVALHLVRPRIFDIRLDEVRGELSTQAAGHLIQLRALRGHAAAGREWAEGEVTLDFLAAEAKASVRGFIFQQRLNGLWAALDFPIIRAYADLFTLEEPAWGDCAFTVGFDKYRNNFDLQVAIAAKAGAYCGVRFDEAEGTIRCRGIWDAVTVIEPLVARRAGKVVASGSLRFDCPADRFVFRANGDGLQPDECFAIVHEPFTELIPEIVGAVPPEVEVEGSIPLLSEQLPSRVKLQGRFRFPQGARAMGLTLAELESQVTMADGCLSFPGLRAQSAGGGQAAGHFSLQIPEQADYAALSLSLSLAAVPLQDVAPLFGHPGKPGSTLDGALTLGCRLDESLRESVDATFDLTLSGGLLTRLPLFAGLTDLLADHVPGISALTDSSTTHLKGSARKGRFEVPEFSLTGDLLSIEGPVKYDLPKDVLSAEVVAGNFKRASVMGVLTRWVTLPVNRFLWKIRVEGPLRDPKWRVVTFVGDLWERAAGKP